MKYTVEMTPDGMIRSRRFVILGLAFKYYYCNSWRVCRVGITDGWVMTYAVGMASDGMKYKPGFMTIDSENQVILRLLPKKF
jgi:hypothetical protein